MHFLPRCSARLGMAALAALIALAAGCRSTVLYDLTGPKGLPDYAAVIASPDRSTADLAIDARRQQPELLKFIEPRPGMTVLDMDAAAGYTTELLARVVGSGGKVYAQDGAQVSACAKARFAERMALPVMKNVEHVTSDFEDPIPAKAAGKLDIVTFLFSYHDTEAMGVDRAVMNRRIFEALKPGGVYIVTDHSAKPGEGVSVAKTLHRIDEALVRREVEEAGFQLLEKARLLRNESDKRDTPVFNSPVQVDEFVLKFVKRKLLN
ncbi:MAG: hypothetical protein MO853_01655 [Candidatus Protistobacter heckmanni]|nr:hypothetical protein [Candidatus Protistobacter heckmanni]